MNLAEKIEKARESRRLRKADVAKSLEIDASHYNKLEKRGDGLSIEQATQIAEAMGMDLIELLTYGEERAAASGTEQAEEMKKLQERVRELEEDKKVLGENLSSYRFAIQTIMLLQSREAMRKNNLEHFDTDEYYANHEGWANDYFSNPVIQLIYMRGMDRGVHREQWERWSKRHGQLTLELNEQA